MSLRIYRKILTLDYDTCPVTSHLPRFNRQEVEAHIAACGRCRAAWEVVLNVQTEKAEPGGNLDDIPTHTGQRPAELLVRQLQPRERFAVLLFARGCPCCRGEVVALEARGLLPAGELLMAADSKAAT